MKKSMKTVLIAFLSLTLLLMIAACGNGGSGDSKPANNSSNNAAGNSGGSDKKEKLKVGFAVPDESHPYFILQIGSVKKLVEEQGGELIVANAGMDVNKQISNIENLISSKVQAIIAFPIDPKPLEEPLRKAQETGIKVVGWGSFDLQHADVLVNSDSKEVGRLVGEDAAKWINEKFGGKADVGLIVSTFSSGLTDRSTNLEAAIKKNAPNARIVAKQEALTVADSQKAAENMLTANPNIQMIATIDDSEALGAYEAVKAAGKAKGDFYISGVGATPEGLAKVKESGSVIRATLDMATGEGPKTVVGSIMKLMKGEKVERFQASKLTIVNASNVDQFMKK